MAVRESDILIIGAGHNALTCAFYLASRGLSVTMLESRSVVGGAAVTEEFHPGFRNSTASYTVSLLNPKIIRDMRLYQHGLKVVLRKIDNFLPTEGGDYLLSGRGGLTKREIARHSPADAEHYDAYSEALDKVVGVLRLWLLRAPAQCRWRAFRPAGAAEARRRREPAQPRGAAPPRRFLHQVGGRHPDPLFLPRPRPGPVRLRRRRRPLFQPLCAGLGLRPPPPRLRRGGGGGGRLGPCDRRHGRDHARPWPRRRARPASRSCSTRRSRK